MPEMDDGSAADVSGRQLQTVWVTLTTREARDLLDALSLWAEDLPGGAPDPQWHTHIGDNEGRELTVAIRPDDGEGT